MQFENNREQQYMTKYYIKDYKQQFKNGERKLVRCLVMELGIWKELKSEIFQRM